MKRLFALLLILALAACSSDDVAFTPQASPAIRVSESTTGLPYVALHGATLSGGRYIFVPNVAYLERVGWVLDGAGYDTDRSAPWSLNSKDTMFNTVRLADGQHTITARYFYKQGGRRWMESVSATFTVHNAVPVPTPEPEPTPEPTRTLIFADEFSGSSLDTSKWTSGYPWTCKDGFNYNCTTGELQSYRPGNLSVSDGTLKITAKQDTSGGRAYTSGLIQTYGKFDHTYGLMQARIKFPKGSGHWGAFWNHASFDYGTRWPPEIDVTEVLGRQPSTNHMHFHSEAGGHTDRGHSYTGPDLTADFHVYAVEWAPGSITWYQDGVQRAKWVGSDVPDEKMYLILNLAVGGWGGTPDPAVYPGVMEIDWVRVYR